MLKLFTQETLAILIGTLLEWMEFTYFAYIIDKIAVTFFSNLSHSLNILMAFATFAVSYIARPIGGIIFGIIGDKYGRKPAMYYSLIGMGIATMTIGITPTYTTIGIFSPIVLIISRIIQGISVSGETAGSAIYLIENNSNKPYLASSLTCIFSALGMFVGAMLAVIISLPFIPSWGWRLPFIISGIICGVGIYIRYKLHESQAFLKIQHQGKITTYPIRELFKNYRLAAIRTFSIAVFIGVYIYICNIWWISYVVQNNFLNEVTAKIYATLAQGLVIIFTLLLAFTAEYIGGKWIMRIGLFISIVATYGLFNPHSTWNTSYLISMEILYAIGNASLSATMYKYFADLFPPSIRYTGQSVMWSIAVAIFGGTAPLVAQKLAAINIYWVIAYIGLSAIIALVVLNLKSCGSTGFRSGYIYSKISK
ncbi:MAG: MFS transporter [Burkholderiales bacterium]|nr:MFS transporter [Burkholderiales bacterium]